jgi:hypothetical protein
VFLTQDEPEGGWRTRMLGIDRSSTNTTDALVSRARNAFRKSCDLAENQIRIGSPDEGFGIPIASV